MISSPSGKEYGITREKLMEILPFRNLNTQLVYAMTCDSHIKIGRAHSPQARAQGLQTSHVKFVSLIAMWHPSIISEPDAHRTLQQFRVRSEWFQDNIEVRTHIGKWFGLECERRPFCLGLVKKDNESLRAAYERSRFRQ